MNQTEIQVCWILAEPAEGAVRPRTPQALGQLAGKLCIPDSRIANQLPKLVKRGFISRVDQVPGRAASDGRLKFYCLTPEGCSQVDKFLQQIAPIEQVLYWITSQKTDEAIADYVRHLRGGLSANAFDSLNQLEAAILGGALPAQRKLPLPLWELLAPSTGRR
ncbi:hypothetical protein [Polaromonas sp.]|uniref:hypothetical protein n=1 Tax=Polaromonas sp. TaxID=1869339 RepID=UPI003263BEB1